MDKLTSIIVSLICHTNISTLPGKLYSFYKDIILNGQGLKVAATVKKNALNQSVWNNRFIKTSQRLSEADIKPVSMDSLVLSTRRTITLSLSILSEN